MKKKIIFGTILLILLSLIGFLYLRSDSIFPNAKKELFAMIENTYQIELEVDEVDFWPLNQLVLRDIEITDNNNNLVLSAPEIKIYYNFFDIIRQDSNRLDSIYYLELINPDIIVKGSDREINVLQFLKQISGLQVAVEKGRLFLEREDGDLLLEDLSSSVQFINSDDFRLTLESGIELNGLKREDFYVDDLSIDQIQLDMTYMNGQWQANLETGFLDLDEFSHLLSETPFSAEIGQVAGSGKLELNASGEELDINEYRGSLTLQNVNGKTREMEYLSGEYFSNLEGQLIFDSDESKVFFKDIYFDYAQNPYNFKGSLSFENGQYHVFGNLISSELELAHSGFSFPFLKDDFNLSGTAQMDLTLSGKITEPEINLNFYLPRGRVNEERINDFKTYLRYRKGMVYLDFLNIYLDTDSFVSAQGVYDSKVENYSFNLESSNFELALLRKYLDYEFLDSLEGRLKTDLAVTGRGTGLSNFNLIGELEVLEARFEEKKIKDFRTAFWMADSELFLSNGSLNLGGGKIDFSGELKLPSTEFNLSLTGDRIDLSRLDDYSEGVRDLAGYASFKGDLKGNLNNPRFELSLNVPEASVSGYRLTGLETELSYYKNKLEFRDFTAWSQGAALKGDGILELTSIHPYLNARFTVNDYQYSSLAAVTGYPLPLEGRLAADLNIKGRLSNLIVNGKIESTEPELAVEGEKYLLDRIKLNFSWEMDRPLEINELMIVKGDGVLTSSGTVNEDILNLDLFLNQFPLSNLDQKLEGSLSLDGLISGNVMGPEIRGSLQASDVKYQEKELDDFKGDFLYKDKQLHLSGLNWQIGSSHYLIQGEYSRLQDNDLLDLEIMTEDGKVDDLIFEIPDLPLPEDYHFKGRMNLKGTLDDLSTLIDLTLFNNSSAEEKVWIKGELGKKLDLSLKGRDVEVSLLPIKQDIDLGGKLDFEGTITGITGNYSLQLTTGVESGKVNDFAIGSVSGEVELNNGLLYLDQKMKLADESSLNVKGSLPIRDQEEMDLLLGIHGIPLPLLSSAFSHLPEMEGYIDGEVYLEGPAVNPDLDGELFVFGGGIDFGFSDKVSLLNGDLIFEDKRIKLDNITGKYGEGDIKLTGSIIPFDSNNSWDLQLTGKDLPFNFGSYNGQFNPEVEITGPFYRPMISGELFTHDLVISLPFSWPYSGENRRFKPEFDLTLYPGDDVYLRNDNIDVLIQEGTLDLSYIDEELELNGVLTSRQGSFDYYNNKFILDSGTATFRRFNGKIPEMSIEAWTKVKGTRIIIQLDGPADNMISTFQSEPPLSDEDILNLLTSKGSIGELADENWDNIISREFLRVFNDFFQLGFVNNIERGIKKVFSLDYLEIDAYDFGWSQEVTVYLGKSLTDRIYLEYISTLEPGEKEGELALKYYLDEHSLFEGSWLGEDEYSLSIETGIEF